MQSWTSSMIRLPNYTWCPNAKTFLLSVLSNWPIDEDFMINITMVFGEIFLRYWWTALHIIVAFSGPIDDNFMINITVVFFSEILVNCITHYSGLFWAETSSDVLSRRRSASFQDWTPGQSFGWWIWYPGWWLWYLGMVNLVSGMVNSISGMVNLVFAGVVTVIFGPNNLGWWIFHGGCCI